MEKSRPIPSTMARRAMKAAGNSEILEALQIRLEEMEQTIEALRTGSVDAIVVAGGGGDKVYTLEGADSPYRNIVETMNSGAVTIDSHGNILYCNGAFSRMTGFPLERVMGSSFRDLVLEAYRPSFSDFLKKNRDGRKTTKELAIRKYRGKLFVHLSATTHTRDELSTTYMVITDITRRQAAEESLRKAHEELERRVEERTRELTVVNEALRSEIKDRKRAEEVAAEEIIERTRIEEELRRSRDELEHRVRGRTEELRRTNEKLNEQIREREQVEEQLRQSQKMEAIGTLAGGIAHDFNNMLAVIIGNADLAVDDLDDRPETRRYIEQIFMAAKRARDLVKQILTFSRKTERQKHPISLTPLVKETFQLLRGTLPTSIRMDLDVRTEADTILADPSQIQQVLINLSTNAAHAMHEKSGTLSVTLSSVTFARNERLPDSDMRTGAHVKLVVADTGSGMTESVRRRIFEPFFTTKGTGQGTGMGLAVVYGIVKSHSGGITVESRPGTGTRFTIFLPLAAMQASEEREDPRAVARGRERILLVDDESLFVDMASRMLESLGYEMTTAQGGPEGLEIFLADPGRFDLVITDQIMPDLPGINLAKRMLEARKDTPIILLTGYSDLVTPEKAKAAGIAEFVMKPIDKREAAETIRRVLDRSKANRSAAASRA